MAREREKITHDDLEWIVNNRYKNHKSSLRIYALIDQHRQIVTRSKSHRSSAQTLLGVAFSLWRAVFLARLKKNIDSMIKDAESFLVELIDSNIVTYSLDRENKDWTFRYYMSNARYRLKDLHGKFDHKEHPFNLWGDVAGISPQQQWVEVQNALDAAIDSFEKILGEEFARKAFTLVRKVKVRPRKGSSSREN